MIYLISCYFIITIIICLVKKKNSYETFTMGVKEGLKVVFNMFCSLIVFVIAINSLEACGVIEDLISLTDNKGSVEIIIQMIIRPLSSSSSMAIMLKIYDKYGVDSSHGVLSTLIHSICDTVFYMACIYFMTIEIYEYKKALKYGIITVIIGYILSIAFILLIL